MPFHFPSTSVGSFHIAPTLPPPPLHLWIAWFQMKIYLHNLWIGKSWVLQPLCRSQRPFKFFFHASAFQLRFCSLPSLPLSRFSGSSQSLESPDWTKMAPLLILDTHMGVKKLALDTLNPSHILCGSVMRDKSMALTRPSSTHWLRGKATSTSGSGFTSTRRTNYRLACRTPFSGFRSH